MSSLQDERSSPGPAVQGQNSQGGTGRDDDDDDAMSEQSDTTSSSASTTHSFPYERDKIVEAITNFYSLLTELFLPTSVLKLPPAGGWPNIWSGPATFHKTDLVMDLLRHLPYIANDGPTANSIHYKCNVVDYSTFGPSEFARADSEFESFAEAVDLPPEDAPHCFLLARGYESGGRNMILNTATGELLVDMIRSLTIVPVLGEEARAENLSPEEEADESKVEDILKTEIRASEESLWTDLDFRWVRHLYRKHGWPEPDYEKNDALKAIEVYKAGRE
ncbi:hypothetical protein E8E14_007652 [Neopestalotiopsis sp. 37M]|nr:hypothetical protein E8E14_007652 [Neopestalotiopsis sp. 37M]